MSSSASGQENTEPDDVNVGLIATVTIVGALLVVAIAAALTALVRSESASYALANGTNANLGTVARLKAEQRGTMEAAPAWVDQAKGRVALPIERAMAVVTAEIRTDPNLATPTPPPPPAPPVEAAPAEAEGDKSTDKKSEGASQKKAPEKDEKKPAPAP